MDIRLSKHALLSTLPPEWPENLLPEVRRRVAASGLSIVVLDDDPTGTQTVYDVPILTEWSVDVLRKELLDTSAFYVLTNSRSLSLAQAQALSLELGRNLQQAARQVNRRFIVISRSDSTLRGHFPGETDALEQGLGKPFDATILIPFFLEGGRFTVDDIHYVEEEGQLVPAAETEFAKDTSFGFEASNLREWVVEKTEGRVRSDDITSISLETLRKGNSVQITEQLMKLKLGGVCVINAVSMRDLEVFTCGLMDAEKLGKSFLYRTAASFVQARLGLAPRPFLTAADLSMQPSGGGLTVVGSYVPKTTRQVQVLLEQTHIAGIELDVATLLDEAHRDAEVERVRQHVSNFLADRDVVIYTSRQLVTTEGKDGNLLLGGKVSESIVEIVRGLSLTPRYLLAKGGITSSDVATRGLNIKRAVVLGQLFPGVPVWQPGEESRYPNMPYIVFPGNVGMPNTLAEVVKALRV